MRNRLLSLTRTLHFRLTLLFILLACATAVGRDPHRSDAVVDRLASLVLDTPVRRLTFTRCDDPWTVLASG